MKKSTRSPLWSLAFLVGGLSVSALFMSACEPPVQVYEIEPGSDPASGAMLVTADDTYLVIASEDHDEVLVVERDSKTLVHRIAVGDGPTHVVQHEAGEVYVTNRYSHGVSIIDIASGEVTLSAVVGVEPYGLTVLDDGRIAVTLAGEAALAILHPETLGIEAKIPLAQKDPRAVVQLNDGDVYVTHLTAGTFSRVAIDDATAHAFSVQTRNDSGPDVHPNHLRSITPSVDGSRVAVAHSQANVDTIRAPIEDGFNELGGDCGYSGCATELGAVVPAVTEVNVHTDEVEVPERVVSDRNDGFEPEPDPVGDCFDCGFGGFVPNPPSIMNPFETRFGGVPLNNPVAMAYIDGGRGQIIIHQGTQNALITILPLTGQASDIVGVVRIGHGATSVALGKDGKNAYVWNQFDGSVSEIELPKMRRGEASPAAGFDVGEGEAVDDFSAFEGVPEFTSETTVVMEDALAPDASLGRRLFHDATDTRISTTRAVSCASCHPDGRSDGQTWQFTFGPRNTPQLGGGILETAPFHWPGDVATHRDLNTMTVLAFMGGTGLDAGSMDAIAAFIDSIPAAPSIAALTGRTPAAERGRDLFYRDDVGCAECHSGAHFTDNKNWDIGSRASSVDIESFQTPVLHGLSRTAPYLHDGSALTLRDLVNAWVATDRMGNGAHLSATELDELIAFLETL